MLARALIAIALTALPLASQSTVRQPVPPRLSRLVPASPAPASFIADVPRLLTPEARERLDQRIRAVQDSGLGDIGIAIMPSIGDYPAYEMGTAIYRTWGIGRIDSIGAARRDLGVLLLIVPRELAPDGAGHCWITTGNGAEAVITDAIGGAICRERIIPHLRERNHEAALSAGIEAIADEVRQELIGVPATALSTPPQGRREGSANPLPAVLVIGGLLTLAGAGIGIPMWLRRRPRRCPKCNRQMRRLEEAQDDVALSSGQQLEERIGSVDYDVWQCACGEDLVVPYAKMFSGYTVCDACRVRAVKTWRNVLQQPTYTSTGLAEDLSRCEGCHRTSSSRVVLARRTPPSQGGSSGGRSRSSGGGGRSFGGSGRSSGGGGGSRY